MNKDRQRNSRPISCERNTTKESLTIKTPTSPSDIISFPDNIRTASYS